MTRVGKIKGSATRHGMKPQLLTSEQIRKSVLAKSVSPNWASTSDIDEMIGTGISQGGRDMMRIIISMLEGKVDSEKSCIDKCLVKDIDHHLGRKSAFKEVLDLLQRDLNMLEHNKS